MAKRIVILRYPHGWNKGGIFPNDVLPSITTSSFENNNFLIELTDMDEPKVRQVFNLIPDAKFNNTHRGRVYDPEGIAPTIYNYAGGGDLHAKIICYEEDKQPLKGVSNKGSGNIQKIIQLKDGQVHNSDREQAEKST